MNWTTVIWSMNAGICLTLVGVYLLVWFRDRNSRVNLSFSFWVFSVGCWSIFELALMHSRTPEQYGQIVRWMHVPMWSATVGFLWFVRSYLRAGRLWLLWTILGLATLKLVINFVVEPNVTFSEITALHQVSFLGEMVAVPVAVSSAWARIGLLITLLTPVFVVDGAVTAWRRQRHRKALVMAGAMLISSVGCIALAIIAVEGYISLPIIVSIPSFVTILLVAYELSRALQRAHQVSQELEQSRERMSLAVEAANLGIWEWNIAGEELWANEVSRMRFGLHLSERFSFGRFLESIHPDDRELIQQKMQHLQESWGDFEVEYRMISTDGETRWIMVKGQAEHGLKGKPFLLRGVSMDITEGKRAQEALHISEEKFRQFFKNSPDYCYIISREGNILHINESALEALGYQREELIGKPLASIYAPESLSKMEHLFAEWKQTGQIRDEEMVIMTRKGERRVVILNVGSVRDKDGQILHSMSVQMDITDRKNTEKALREREASLREAQRIAHLGSWELDLVTNKLMWSDEIFQIFEVDKECFGASYEFFLSTIHPDDREAVNAAYTQSLQTRKPYAITHRLLMPDGRIKYVHEKCETFYGPNGKPLLSIGTVQDITERKRSEKELFESREALRDFAGKLLTIQEEERRRLARELHDDFTQRLAILSLDITKLIKKSKSAADLCLDDLSDIKEQVIKLSTDIHAISRQLHPSIIDDIGLVRAIESECRNFTKHKGIIIKYETTDITSNIPRDVSICLFRITQEALRNIFKHSKAAQAKVTLFENDSNITLIVEDSGIGFDPDRLVGKGLGLVSMQERARLCRGNLTVKSVPSQGTEIKVTVPLTGFEDGQS